MECVCRVCWCIGFSGSECGCGKFIACVLVCQLFATECVERVECTKCRGMQGVVCVRSVWSVNV